MNNFKFLDFLTILSFVISVENLQLNVQQSQQIDDHLHTQDEKLLKKIIQQNEEIIKLLEENK